MNRPAFLAASAATTAMAGVKTAAADTLPLGPLPEMRYPDVHIESGWRPPPRRLASSAACRYTIRAQLTANTLSIDHSAFRVAEAPSARRFATLPAATRDKERCRHHSNKCTAAT